MELSCGLYQSLPILRIFTDVVLAKLSVYLFEFRVETHHQFFELCLIGDLVPNCHKFLFGFFEDQVSE